MIDLRISSLYVTRDIDGVSVRFTIPTMHSSTVLTPNEVKILRDELTKYLRTRRIQTGV